MKRVLIADDEYVIANLFRQKIQKIGHEVVGVAHSGEEAKELISQLHPEIIFLDVNMEYKTVGIDVCKWVNDEFADIKVYFLTAYSNYVFKEELKNVDYEGYIDKLEFSAIVGDLLK